MDPTTVEIHPSSAVTATAKTLLLKEELYLKHKTECTKRNSIYRTTPSSSALKSPSVDPPFIDIHLQAKSPTLSANADSFLLKKTHQKPDRQIRDTRVVSEKKNRSTLEKKKISKPINSVDVVVAEDEFMARLSVDGVGGRRKSFCDSRIQFNEFLSITEKKKTNREEMEKISRSRKSVEVVLADKQFMAHLMVGGDGGRRKSFCDSRIQFSEFISVAEKTKTIRQEKEKEKISKPRKSIEVALAEELMGRLSVGNNVGRRRSFLDSSIELSEFFSRVSARIVTVDMPPFMQIHAVSCARKVYDGTEKLSSKFLASTLKKEFDSVYGPAWHCIVGSSFGSFITHSVGGFLYFSIDKLYILLFKTTVQKAED